MSRTPSASFRTAGILMLLPLTLGLMACGDDGTGSEGPARVQVLLTDAPSDQIESAEIWVSRVYLQPGDDSDSSEGEGTGRAELFNDPDNPRHYDLLDLRNGVVADLTEPVSVESGIYGQLRLVVDSARITLVEGSTFADGSTVRSLEVPSGSSSGIKVQLARPLDAEAGELTIILVDFDVDRNFVFQGPADRPNGVLFTPTLVELERSRQDAS